MTTLATFQSSLNPNFIVFTRKRKLTHEISLTHTRKKEKQVHAYELACSVAIVAILLYNGELSTFDRSVHPGGKCFAWCDFSNAQNHCDDKHLNIATFIHSVKN